MNVKNSMMFVPGKLYEPLVDAIFFCKNSEDRLLVKQGTILLFFKEEFTHKGNIFFFLKGEEVIRFVPKMLSYPQQILTVFQETKKG
jgi:hypothetical protein